MAKKILILIGNLLLIIFIIYGISILTGETIYYFRAAHAEFSKLKKIKGMVKNFNLKTRHRRNDSYEYIELKLKASDKVYVYKSLYPGFDLLKSSLLFYKNITIWIDENYLEIWQYKAGNKILISFEKVLNFRKNEATITKHIFRIIFLLIGTAIILLLAYLFYYQLKGLIKLKYKKN